VGRKRKTRAESDSESDDESDAGEVYTSIKSYEDGSTIEDYRVAVSKSAINPHLLQGSKIRFEKLFQDGSYMASGVIDISVGGAKGAKPTRHCFMSFAVMSGRVEVKLNRTAFVIGKGGVFVVPRGTTHYDHLTIGNVYSIKNVGDKSCRLFFSQAVEEGLPEEAEQKESED
jgi:centromere protein C